MSQAERFRFAVGAQIRMERERLGWTRPQAVNRLPTKISDRTLLTYESGERNITMPRLWEICAALGLDVAKVITDAAQATATPPPCLTCKGTGVEPADPDGPGRAEVDHDERPSALVGAAFPDAAPTRLHRRLRL